MGRRGTGTAGRGFAWLLPFSIAYVFLTARPMPLETVPVPAFASWLGGEAAGTGEACWSGESRTAPAESAPGKPGNPADSLVPFNTGGRFGYVHPDGRVEFARQAASGVAMDASGWAEYPDATGGFVARSPFGLPLFESRLPGVPYFSAGRKFMVSRGQDAVMELDGRGSVLWRREFASPITAFAVSPGLVVVGMLDGHLEGLDTEGGNVFDATPEGSSLPCIYGVAVSRDGDLVAAVSGRAPQRFVVYSRKEGLSRVTHDAVLPEETIRSVPAAFAPDGTGALLGWARGIIVYDAASNRSSLRNLLDRAPRVLKSGDSQMYAALTDAKDGDVRLLTVTGPGAVPVFSGRFAASDAGLFLDGTSIYVATDGWMYRINLEKR